MQRRGACAEATCVICCGEAPPQAARTAKPPIWYAAGGSEAAELQQREQEQERTHVRHAGVRLAVHPLEAALDVLDGHHGKAQGVLWQHRKTTWGHSGINICAWAGRCAVGQGTGQCATDTRPREHDKGQRRAVQPRQAGPPPGRCACAPWRTHASCQPVKGTALLPSVCAAASACLPCGAAPPRPSSPAYFFLALVLLLLPLLSSRGLAGALHTAQYRCTARC